MILSPVPVTLAVTFGVTPVVTPGVNMSAFHPRCGGDVTLGEEGREARGRGGAHGGVVFSLDPLKDGDTFSVVVDQGWGEVSP